MTGYLDIILAIYLLIASFVGLAWIIAPKFSENPNMRRTRVIAIVFLSLAWPFFTLWYLWLLNDILDYALTGMGPVRGWRKAQGHSDSPNKEASEIKRGGGVGS